MQHWLTGNTPMPISIGEALGLGTGEQPDQFFLISAHDIDGKATGIAKQIQLVIAQIQRPQNQRRIERDRIEGIDRQP